MKVCNDKISQMMGFNSGIYSIRNKINGKLYIGSSKNLNGRKNEHFRDLRKNKHYNEKLQNAYNKYGENNLCFEIIEYISPPLSLKKVERIWIISLDAVNKGYNLTDETEGGPYKGRKLPDHLRKKRPNRKSGIVIDPDGNVIEFSCVTELCKENNITDISNFYNMLDGKGFHSHGFRKYNINLINVKFDETDYRSKIAIKTSSKKFKLICPQGKVYEGLSIVEFCKDKNLNKYVLANLIRNNGIVKSYKGWRRFDPNLIGVKFGKTRGQFAKIKLISPDGEIIESENISKFCRERCLHKSNVGALLLGRYKHKHYLGWRKYDESLVGTKISKIKNTFAKYKFISPDGVLYEGKNISKFAKGLGLRSSSFNALDKGILKSYKGWKKYVE